MWCTFSVHKIVWVMTIDETKYWIDREFSYVRFDYTSLNIWVWKRLRINDRLCILCYVECTIVCVMPRADNAPCRALWSDQKGTLRQPWLCTVHNNWGAISVSVLAHVHAAVHHYAYDAAQTTRTTCWCTSTWTCAVMVQAIQIKIVDEEIEYRSSYINPAAITAPSLY